MTVDILIADTLHRLHEAKAEITKLTAKIASADVEVRAVRDAAASMSKADGYPEDGSGPVAYIHKLRNMVAMLNGRAREDAAALLASRQLVAQSLDVIDGFFNEDAIKDGNKPCRVTAHGFCLAHDMGPCLVAEAHAFVAKAKTIAPDPKACSCGDLTDKIKALEADPRMRLDIKVLAAQVRLGSERGVALRKADKVIAEAIAWVPAKNLDEDHHHYDHRAVAFVTRCKEARAAIHAVGIESVPDGNGGVADIVGNPWAPEETAK